jgi:hypothetical protein
MSDETPTPESPMSSETTALDILKGQVESLTKQLLESNSQRDEYRDALSEISGERDTLKSKVASPDAQAARIAELEGTIRDRAHYDKFAELATASKAKAKALKSLWRDAQTLAGYKVEGDEIDDHALQTVVAKLKTEVDYAFDPEESGNVTAAHPASPDGSPGARAARPTSRTKYGLDIGSATEPAGGGRASRNQGIDGTIVTQEMRADPRFMLDPKNKQLIGDAAREGRFR